MYYKYIFIYKLIINMKKQELKEIISESINEVILEQKIVFQVALVASAS